MSEIALAKINSFAPVAQQAQVDVSPEEPIFILTTSQLQEIISRAIQPLQDRIDRFANQKEKIAALEATQDIHAENDLNQLRLINSLLKEPQPLQKDRGEKTKARILKLKEVLKARGQGMTFKEVGRLLEIKPNQVTALVLQLDKRVFEIFARAGDTRLKVIRLRSFT